MNTFDKQELVKQINQFYGVDVQSTERYLEIVNAKKAICYYMRNIKRCTFQEIANLIGTHHATVMHHVTKHENLMKFDKKYRDRYNEFLESITPKDKRWLCIEFVELRSTKNKRWLCNETKYLPNFNR